MNLVAYVNELAKVWRTCIVVNPIIQLKTVRIETHLKIRSAATLFGFQYQEYLSKRISKKQWHKLLLRYKLLSAARCIREG